MFKILGTDDAVNTCDCCGKSNLKYTVTVERDDGEILHYGSTCATRHTGKTSKEIKHDVDAALRARIEAAQKEYRATHERAAFENACNKAHAAKLLGKPFKEAVALEAEADRAARIRIAEKYKVSIWQF